jgi:hypothetical protein
MLENLDCPHLSSSEKPIFGAFLEFGLYEAGNAAQFHLCAIADQTDPKAPREGDLSIGKCALVTQFIHLGQPHQTPSRRPAKPPFPVISGIKTSPCRH